MALPLRYDAQLIAMVSSDLKKKLVEESVAREVSISQVAREYIEAGIAINRITDRVNETTPKLRHISGLPGPTEEQLRDADGPSLATIADTLIREASKREYTELDFPAELRAKAQAALDNVDKAVEAYAPGIRVTYPDPETAKDAAEQQERNRLDDVDRGVTLSEIAAHLGVDPDAEDVEEVLGHDASGERLARLQARGLL